MITIDIPGYKTLHIKHLVLDFNGTLAIDGEPIEQAIDILIKLSRSLGIHIVTADTHGTVRQQINNDIFSLIILGGQNQSQQKKEYVSKLGASQTIAIGNGYNDHLMLRKAGLGIAILQKEGVSIKTLSGADVIFCTLVDALESINNPARLIATLRH